MVDERSPGDLTGMGTGCEPAREEQALLPEVTDGPGRGAGAPERREERAHGLLHRGVRIEHHPARRIGHEADRQPDLQLAAAGLGALATDQSGLEHMQLGLAHRALEAQQQPVVEVARVIEAVLVADEGLGHGADLEQPMPVGGAAREAADLETEHDAHLAHAHRGDQACEALPVAVGARAPLVAVDDDDPLMVPAERDRPLPQRVLAPGALGVLHHLAQRALADIQIRLTRQVVGGHLLVGLRSHDTISFPRRGPSRRSR